MLNSLHIENIAVVKSADIDLGAGFTVFSGETGAGKSVIIESIKLLLGGKFDKELIRHGEDLAMVSALITDLTPSAVTALSECGFSADEDSAVLIQRSVSREGKNQIKINGRAAGVGVLKSLMPSLITIHGQNETNVLADADSHLTLIDTYATNVEILEEYSSIYTEYTRLDRELSDLLEKRAEGARIRDLLAYQIKEIDSMNLHDGEEEELVDKKLKIKNSEKLHKHADFVYKALRGSEKGSVAVLIDRSISSLRQISDVLPECAEYAESMRDMLYKIEEIAEDVAAITDDIDEDPTEALNAIESRLDKISKLKRKYGLTISSILEFRDKCARDLELIDNSEDAERRIRKELDERYDRAHELAVKLHERRIKASAELEKKVKNTLDFLDMPSVVFYASYRELFADGQHKLTHNGFETAEFYISANKGAEAMPMSKIASGGELARIMLALKSALADKDGVGTVIYDEIDAGVSGKTARKIGVKMLELSKTAQLICVTHSAQIASLADTHMLIKKRELDGSVRTELFALDYDGRVGEVSRILGGIDVTESQRRAAIDMIKEKSKLS